MEVSDLPLRERKQAQIKLDVLYALLEKLKEKTIDEVSVEELCERALISKVTFYNYFSNKLTGIQYSTQSFSTDFLNLVERDLLSRV